MSPLQEYTNIYKISCRMNDDVFIGATQKQLPAKLRQFREEYNRWIYGDAENEFNIVFFFFAVDPENVSIELVSRCYSTDKDVIKDWVKCEMDNEENLLRREIKVPTFEFDKSQSRNISYKCECGGSFTRSHKKEHDRTFLHRNYVESLSFMDSVSDNE